MISTRFALTGSLAALVLSGCASSVDAVPTAEFICDDGSRFHATFVDQTALVVMPNGLTITLPEKVSASGFWYADARYEMRGKGNKITWTTRTTSGAGTSTTCVAP